MNKATVRAPVSRSDVADHVDHYFDLEGDQREQIIERMHRQIEGLREIPETSIGYEDDRQDYKDVRSELWQFGNFLYWAFCVLDNLSPEAREALEKNGMWKEDQLRLRETIENAFSSAESAADDLPGIKGKRPVKRRKFACALTCMMFFYELKPEHAKKDDKFLIDFAEDTLELAIGRRDTVMRNSINTAFDLGF